MLIPSEFHLSDMLVHLQDQSGEQQTVECTSILEGDDGLYLMASKSRKLEDAIGYVPFNRLDYAEPDGDGD